MQIPFTVLKMGNIGLQISRKVSVFHSAFLFFHINYFPSGSLFYRFPRELFIFYYITSNFA